MNTKSYGSFAKIGVLVLGVLLLVQANKVQSATITWGGSTGEYTTGANWVGGSTPNLNGTGDTAVINAGAVTYTPGGDLYINGSTLQISGGSWIQAGGIAWIQMGGGTLLINGGTFSQGTAGNIVKTATTSIIVSSGVANFNGNLIYDSASSGALTLSGGVTNVANEFKPIETFTLNGGALNANLISFADGPGSLNITSGVITVNGAGANSGFYGGGTKGLNFITGSTGSLFISTYTLAELTADGFMTNGTIQYNGAANAGLFTLTETGGGVNISLTAVPEPSTYALMALGFGSLWILRRKKINV